MAPASAPAGTVAVIQEYKTKGSLTQALYAVVGFDDGLAIIIFAFAAALARTLLIHEATGTVESFLPAMWAPIKEIALSLGLGGLVGFIFCQLVKRLQSNGDIFILIFAAVMIVNGLALHLHLSLILTNMMVGFVLANLRREAMVRRVMAPLLDVMPLTFVLFFFLAGAHLQLKALPALGLVGTVYIACRSVGLIFGARIGGMFGGVEEKVKKYVGLGILSQAGVAIGLALMVRETFQSLAAQYPGLEHATAIGAETLTTVTATCIFFEVVGPILAKVALEKAGEIPKRKPAHATET
jgi:Kef-type K+ transport system membrane component KefB